jgi:hypothetical protein
MLKNHPSPSGEISTNVIWGINVKGAMRNTGKMKRRMKDRENVNER